MVFFGFSKLIENITDNSETGEVNNADLSHLRVRKLNPYGTLRNTGNLGRIISRGSFIEIESIIHLPPYFVNSIRATPLTSHKTVL